MATSLLVRGAATFLRASVHDPRGAVLGDAAVRLEPGLVARREALAALADFLLTGRRRPELEELRPTGAPGRS